MQSGTCRIRGTTRPGRRCCRDFPRRHGWNESAGGEGAGSLDLGLWRGSRQSCAQDHGHRRNLSRWRNFAKDSSQAQGAAVYEFVSGEGPLAFAAGEHSRASHHQRQSRPAGSGAVCGRKIEQRPGGSVVSAPVDLRRLTTPQDLFQAAAEEVLRTAAEAVAQRGRFTIALSGGSTPRNLYTLIAANASATLPWAQMFFFWGDERHVGPDDADSNYRMAKETLLSKVPIPAANIFRVPSEDPDAAAAAD